MPPNEPTVTEFLQKFVAMSTTDKEVVEEFVRITEKYEELARELKESGIPQRRAELILELIDSRTPPRTHQEVAVLLGMTSARVSQILKAARRRAEREISGAE